MKKLACLLIALLCASLSACARQSQTGPIAGPPSPPPPPPLFTDNERAALIAYWNAPGRYRMTAPREAVSKGPFQARLTPEGSTWLLAYTKASTGSVKVPPTQDFHASSAGSTAAWETWVQSRIAFDKFQAQQTAAAANAPFLSGGPPISPPPAPTTPGPIPPSLLLACGNPPPFASVVAPLEYKITFDDGDTYSYDDNVKMRDRYAYYRFAKGVNTGGVHIKDLPPGEADAVFRSAGLAPVEQHALAAVSPLEGGFDAVQTYDTGFISVGFIQFVSMSDGHHDLSAVLLQEKADQPDSFADDFHKFGIDVRLDDTLVVIDPATGAELAGEDAVMRVIEDKRLIAVFQRAARKMPNRVAQVKVAKATYWPADDPVKAVLPGGVTLDGKVSDFIRSEAGLATLLDRKINTGNCRKLNDVVAGVLTKHKCPCHALSEAAPYEREIVASMKYREDFLRDATLGQPASNGAVQTSSASGPSNVIP